MAQATFSVCMDETLKKEFDKLSLEPEITREKAMQAFMNIRAEAKKNFSDGMSLEEINEEVSAARKEFDKR